MRLGPTRYTVTGLRSVKVRFLAGLELYLHLDSTNLRRASLATSSDIMGTLDEQRTTFVLSVFPPIKLNELKADVSD